MRGLDWYGWGLLGEVPQPGLDAAMAHAHPCEGRANVPGSAWRERREEEAERERGGEKMCK